MGNLIFILMEVKTKRILMGCVTIAIIALMIFYVDFQSILLNLQQISILGIFLFSVIYTIAFIFRAFKLKLVFRGINLEPNYFTIYGAIGTGWAINELTPAKLGDIVKMEYIRQKESVFTIDINLKITRIYFQTGNHLLTYFLSILGCIASIAIILFLWI